MFRQNSWIFRPNSTRLAGLCQSVQLLELHENINRLWISDEVSMKKPVKTAAGLPAGKDVSAFLAKVSSTSVVKSSGQPGRLLFAMDATASREQSWDRACQIQGQMFVETAGLGGLEIQLCYYRGFSEFSASPWLAQSGDLLQTMSGVSCLGGHTQIEKVLRHAIRETRQKKINALVFVGDCIEENIDELCSLSGELALLGVPVFVFYEGDDPVAIGGFQQLATLTGGACCPFNSNSAKQLRDLLSAVAVYAAGGRKALEEFQRDHGSTLLRLK